MISDSRALECDGPHDAQKKKMKKRKNELSGKRPHALASKRGRKVSHKEEELAFVLKKGMHPLGIRPLGNLYLASSECGQKNDRDTGLGSLAILKDDIVLDILGLLGAADLGRLAAVSKSLYVFAHHEELWRPLVLQDLGGRFRFHGTWKGTYTAAKQPLALRSPLGENDANHSHVHRPLQVTSFFSDLLFQSWLCASLEMKPEWLRHDNVPRRSNLSRDHFVSEFEEPGRPVIITDCLSSWPALSRWNREYLLKVAGDAEFAVGPVEMSLQDYYAYADSVREERPLYLFDPRFAEKVPQLAKDYSIPEYFSEDLFSILGKDRPDYRWLIMGPARSGSSFHIDPNATSAWNAVISGAKKWILYPPGSIPPGVHPSPDGADVASPVSLPEWFMNFYGRPASWRDPGASGDMRPVEGICRAGELIFVPHGWWHAVVNLESSVAITQNYVSRSNLLDVLEFLDKPNARELVSGTADRESLHDMFQSAHDKIHPGIIDELKHKEKQKLMASQEKLGFWGDIADSVSGGFKFSF